jgi:archaellum component FlaC
MTSTQDKDLVILALKQRIGEIVSEYEGRIATIRAEYTILSSTLETVSSKLASLEEKNLLKSDMPSVKEILEA